MTNLSNPLPSFMLDGYIAIHRGPRGNFWIEDAEYAYLPRGGKGAGATIESPFLLRSFSTFFRFLIFLKIKKRLRRVHVHVYCWGFFVLCL